jgi:hypothetical protein
LLRNFNVEVEIAVLIKWAEPGGEEVRLKQIDPRE